MDALLRRRLMMQAGGGPTPPTPTINYLVAGSPSISGDIMVPDTTARGFVYTNKPFNPDTSEWIIQTRVKINTSAAYKDIIASVDAEGNMEYSIVVQFDTGNSNKNYGLFLSTNGTSWDLTSATPNGTMSPDTWRTFQVMCTRSGSNYIYKMGFPELDSWTSTVTKTTHPVFGKYIAFGGGFANTSADCEIDLSYTKIWVGGELWWSALPLPTGYTELEMLSNLYSAVTPSTMAFINPSVSAQAIGKYISTMKYTGSNSWANVGDGCVYNSATPRFYMMAGVISANSTTPKWGAQFGGDSSDVTFSTAFTQDFHTIELNALTGKALLDGAGEISFTTSSPPNIPLYVFNRSVNSGYGANNNYYYGSRRKTVKIFNRNSALIRYLVPAKNSSGISGMYDHVNNVFYTSPNESHFDQDDNHAGALKNWTLHASQGTASYSSGTISLLCGSSNDYSNWNTWVGDIKTIPWWVIEGKTIKVRIKTNSIIDGAFTLSINSASSITDMANSHSRRKSLSNLTLAEDGYYEQTFVCNLANFTEGGSFTPGSSATFGIVCFSRSTANTVYIYDTQILIIS